MRDGLARVGTADLVVGIPSFRNAATIGHVAGAVASGLRSFEGTRAAIVHADGGSRDGTLEAAAAALDGSVPLVAGEYVGLPGKGSALRAIFEATDALGARAGAVVDSDLRSITPEWIRRLLGPIADGRADYVTPLYARHKHDGTITNSIAYPLTRALYGVSIRQPIGGEFGFSRDLARSFARGGALGDGVWQTDVARFGIDIYMTTTALLSRARVAQAFLGAKVHDPKDPGADLAPMFSQVVGTLFRIAARNADAWRGVRGSRAAPVIGDVAPVEPEEVRASVEILERKYAAGRSEHEATWREVLERVPETIDARTWARLVYDFLAAFARDPDQGERYLRALVPLYFARVARFIADARDLTTAESERLVEEQAVAFEELKDHLRDRLS
ncbi:MAG TPA: glycosyltransferase [Candidatus Limnocylindria bacterium]|nr:glycosyltransferase [Candidatus Limnocylindria bacterium]